MAINILTEATTLDVACYYFSKFRPDSGDPEVVKLQNTVPSQGSTHSAHGQRSGSSARLSGNSRG